VSPLPGPESVTDAAAVDDAVAEVFQLDSGGLPGFPLETSYCLFKEAPQNREIKFRKMSLKNGRLNYFKILIRQQKGVGGREWQKVRETQKNSGSVLKNYLRTSYAHY